jgi:CRP-like cAMP-binding protein
MAESRILREIPFFKDFTDKELAELEKHVAVKFFQAGAVLREQAGMDMSFHIIRSGEVAVFKGHGTEQEVRLAKLGANEFFGEMAFLSDSRRGATIVATRDTSTATLPLGLLMGYEKERPAIAMKFYRQFLLKTIDRLRAMNEKLESLERGA